MKPETFKFLFLILFIMEESWQFILSNMNARWIAGRSGIVPEYLKGSVSSEELEKAAAYTAAKTRMENISSLLESSLIIILVTFGLIGILDSCLAWLGSGYSRAALFFAALLIGQEVLEIPLGLYSTFVIEERFGFNKTTPGLFLKDWIKNLLLSLLLAIPLFLILVWFISSFESWWLYSWLFFALYSLGVTLAYPRIIAPIFNKFSPLAPGTLSNEISRLMDQCHLSIKEVKVMDASRRSSHSNAYFTGLGKSKRIVLYDTLVSRLSEPEIISVLAHELGHSKKLHVLKKFFLSQALALAGFFLLDLMLDQDFIFAGLGLNKNSWSALVAFGLVASVVSFWLAPVLNRYSRKNEFEADAFATDVLGTGEHLASALISLGKENLSSPEPHPLFVKWRYSHPAIGERITRMKKARQGRLS